MGKESMETYRLSSFFIEALISFFITLRLNITINDGVFLIIHCFIENAHISQKGRCFSN